MTIIIQGARDTGKTTLVRHLTGSMKTAWVNEFDLGKTFWTAIIPDGVECIVVDDVRKMESTFNFFKQKKLEINRPMEFPFEIPMPKVILIKTL